MSIPLERALNGSPGMIRLRIDLAVRPLGRDARRSRTASIRSRAPADVASACADADLPDGREAGARAARDADRRGLSLHARGRGQRSDDAAHARRTGSVRPAPPARARRRRRRRRTAASSRRSTSSPTRRKMAALGVVPRPTSSTRFKRRAPTRPAATSSAAREMFVIRCSACSTDIADIAATCASASTTACRSRSRTSRGRSTATRRARASSRATATWTPSRASSLMRKGENPSAVLERAARDGHRAQRTRCRRA